MKKTVVLLFLILASCASKQDNVVKIVEQSGKVEVSIKGKDWVSIKSTGSAPILIKDEDGIEQAMNVATLRAKANIIEFINSEVSSSKTFDSSLSSKAESKEISQKVLEKISQDAKGLIKYSYVIERQVKDDYVRVVILVSKDLSQLKINLSN